ncbi:DegQ family serine endoprotease [Candidatus Nitrospira bockiana]
MNGYEPPRSGRRRVSSLGISALLLAVGVIIGLAVASDLGWLPFGHAVPESTERRAAPAPTPTPVAVPPAVVVPDTDHNFVRVAKAVTPAVVNISTTRSGREGGGHAMPFDDPLFRRFFGEEFFRRFEAPRERRERSLGSGVIVDPSGLIITNNHVVNRADEIKVVLSDKREFRAKLIGMDTKTDLALLKVEAEGLHTIPWGDSDGLEVGEFVLAVGNPFGLNQTVTMGIVSAVGRASMGIAEYEDFIQTDAAINPGNSGGALVNARGELIGINTAIFSQNGGNMGIGFAVPSSMARSILEQLVRTGKVVRGWLGVSIQELSGDLAQQFGVVDVKGVLVSEVLEGSPAKRAGIERGDLIVEYDGKPVESPTQLRNAVARTAVGKKVAVKVVRDKRPKQVDVTIVEQPSSVAQAGSDEPEPSVAPAGVLSDLEVRDVTSDIARRLGLGRSEGGIVIVKVRPGGAAEEAGLKDGDLILEVNRRPITNLKAYEQAVSRLPKDQAVLLLIKRQGRTSFVTVRP